MIQVAIASYRFLRTPIYLNIKKQKLLYAMLSLQGTSHCDMYLEKLVWLLIM